MNINAMKILSINSDAKNLTLIEKYTDSLSLLVDSFQDSRMALDASKSCEYNLVIVDYLMPALNGVEFIQAFRHNNANVPIIMLSSDEKLQEKALKVGAYDCLTTPISPILFQARVQNALKLSKAQSFVNNETLLLENEIKEATQAFKENEQEALQIIARVAAHKDHKEDGHTLKIANCAKVLAKAAGLNEKIQDIAFHASQLYDLGKVGIADELLLKPAKLDADEFEIVKSHAKIGYDILKYTQSPYLKAGAVISYSHHEKYDGTGYPIGLKGETIPILGRIVAIVDVFMALTSVRPYKEVWSDEDACAFLIEQKAQHFDPNLVDLFIENFDEIKSFRVG